MKSFNVLSWFPVCGTNTQGRVVWGGGINCRWEKQFRKFGITVPEDLHLAPACNLFCSNCSLYSDDNWHWARSCSQHKSCLGLICKAGTNMAFCCFIFLQYFFNTEEFLVMPSENVCLGEQACGCVRHGERACLRLTHLYCFSGWSGLILGTAR